MRVKKMSALTLVAAAAGLSLTACGSGEGTNDASPESKAPSSTKGGGLAARSATSSGSTCRTDTMDLSVHETGVQHQLVIHMENTSSETCVLRGFPGVQLVGPDGLGDTGPDAARTDIKGTTQRLAPGEETQFLLRYIPDSNGKTFTRLSVTPPNAHVSQIVNLDDLSFKVAPEPGSSPDVFVYPVGYHTGTGM